MKKKNVSAIVSALGVLTSIFTALVSAVRKNGGAEEDLYRLATPEGENLIDEIAKLIIKAGNKALSLKDLISALRLNWFNSDINEDHFPDDGKRGQVELIDFNHYISYENAIKEMDKKGLRLATVREMLIWAKNNWNGKDYVVALGSVWRCWIGLSFVVCLDGDGSYRMLILRHLDGGCFGGGWGVFWRFACVRKPA